MTAAAILSAVSRRRIQPIDLSGFGINEAYAVRSLTERERSRYESQFLAKDAKTVNVSRLIEAKARLVILCLINAATDQPVFSEADLPQLMEADSGFIDAVYEAAARHCGIKKADVESLAGNSDATTDAA